MSKEKANIQDIRSFMNKARDPHSMRPFIAKDGKPYIIVHKGEDRFEQIPVTNATLRYDEWRMLDDAVKKVAEQRLVGIQDLKNNGLVHNLPNAMATTVLTWEKMSDAMEAAVSIDPVVKGKDDTVDFSAEHLPIPIVHADYSISERLLQESRSRGNPLSTYNAERASRKVLEQLEDMLFSSTDVLVAGGGKIQTYLSHDNVNTVSLGTDWDGSGKSASDIKDDVLAMVQESIDNKYYGPWTLYIPTAYQTVVDDDYDVSGASTQTIRQRLEAIKGIQAVKVVDKLPANTVLLVQMTSDVVDLVMGMDIQNVEWATQGGFVHNYKVMTIQVPRIKADYDGNLGIVKLL